MKEGRKPEYLEKAMKTMLQAEDRHDALNGYVSGHPECCLTSAPHSSHKQVDIADLLCLYFREETGLDTTCLRHERA